MQIRVGYDIVYDCPQPTAAQVCHDRRGVCRDYAHLAITFCRCLNIPAR